MKQTKLYTIILMTLIIKLNVFAQGVDQKIDKLNNKYLAGIKAAKAEKNDDKAIEILKKLNTELSSEFATLKAEMESKFKAMTEAQREEWGGKYLSKPYMKEIIEISMDEQFAERINQNPAMKKAYEDLQNLSKVFDPASKGNAIFSGTTLTLTLNGGKFKNRVFNLNPENLEKASAHSEEGLLKVAIEGFAGNTAVTVFFYVEGEKPVNYSWVGDYNLTTVIQDGKEEITLGGHEGNGTITIEKVESIGGWVVGKFSGKLLEENNPTSSVQVIGTFKVKRQSSEE